MNQLEIVSGPTLVQTAQIQDANFFFSIIWLDQLLDIMISYHYVQILEKNQWSNLEKT